MVFQNLSANYFDSITVLLLRVLQVGNAGRQFQSLTTIFLRPGMYDRSHDTVLLLYGVNIIVVNCDINDDSDVTAIEVQYDFAITAMLS